jgi:hypothetical protein
MSGERAEGGEIKGSLRFVIWSTPRCPRDYEGGDSMANEGAGPAFALYPFTRKMLHPGPVRVEHFFQAN